MASIKLGPLVSDIRGSIGGTVLSRNNGGAYAKARVCPVNPNSAAQQVVRSIMASMFTFWSALSAGVRTAWGVYAANVSMVNRLGDVINCTGYNMYARTRAVCQRIGIAIPAAAPTIFTLAEQDSSVGATPSAGTNTLGIIFDNTLGWANEIGGWLIVYQGLPQNPAVTSYKGPYRLVNSIAGAVIPPTSPEPIVSMYTLTVGQKCPLQFRIIRADGRLSSTFRVLSTVGA